MTTSSRAAGPPRAAIIAAFAWLAAAPPTLAHPGLHHDIEAVSRRLEQSPDRADLWTRRGRLHRLDDDPSASLADLDRAVRLAPQSPDAALQRGLTLAALRRDADAQAELTRAFSLGAGAAEGYAVRARLRAAAGRLREAAADYAEALKRDPDVDVYRALGRLHEASGRPDLAAAVLREGLSKLGGAVVLRRELIRVEKARGNHDAALTLIDEQLAQPAVKSDWYLLRAEVLTAAGRAESARADLRRALDESNRALARRASAIHLVRRARIHAATGDAAAARADLKRALEQSPRYPEALDLLAELDR